MLPLRNKSTYYNSSALLSSLFLPSPPFHSLCSWRLVIAPSLVIYSNLHALPQIVPNPVNVTQCQINGRGVIDCWWSAMSHAVHKPLVFSLLITTGPFPWSEGCKPTLHVEVSWVLQVFICRSPAMTGNLSFKYLHLERTALITATWGNSQRINKNFPPIGRQDSISYHLWWRKTKQCYRQQLGSAVRNEQMVFQLLF